MSSVLIRLLTGWRQVRVKGLELESLITVVVEGGFRLWRVERHKDELWALISEEGYEALAALARERGLEVSTLKRGGLPFRWRQMRHRPFLLVGLATAWMIVLYATSHIWAINVTVQGLSPTAKAQLVQTAERSGLRIGSNERRLDIPHIRRLMLSGLPEYSWIGIHTRGMVAIIDGIRFVDRPPNHLPPRLVATHAGKITAVYVYMGAPDVQVGESVRKGQSLIAGVVSDISPIQPKDAKQPTEQSVVTPAEGEVMADITFRVKVFQPYTYQRLVRTGQVAHQRFIQFVPGGVFALPSLQPKRFPHYTVEKNVNPVRFAGVGLPVRVIDLVYNKEVKHTVRLNRREAVRRGRERALADLRIKIPKDGKRVGATVKVSYVKQGVWVTMTWTVNDNIAAPPRAARRS